MKNFKASAEQFISKPKQEEQKKDDNYYVNPKYIEKKTKRIQLLIKESTYKKLKEKSIADKTSVNALVNDVLENVLG